MNHSNLKRNIHIFLIIFHFKFKYFFYIKIHKEPQMNPMFTHISQFHTHTTILYSALICKPGHTPVEKQITPILGLQGELVAYSIFYW